MTRSKKHLALGLGLIFTMISASFSGARPLGASGGCDGSNPETCLYTSDLSFNVGIADGIVLVDPARDNYEIPLLVRFSIGAPGPRPVVIWNHGGAPSANGKTRSEEWGNTLAAAGYVVIHPSRLPVDSPSKDLKRECKANGFKSSVDCDLWISDMRFGAQTTHFLIDHLAQIEAANLALKGQFDMTKIVVAGHSAGTTTVLSNAGAFQQWVTGGTRYEERDDRPIAFLASGPQGPMYAGFASGFQTTSFLKIDRPFMFITGVGDETGEPIPTRVIGWITSIPGNKALVWDTEPGAVHETMDINKCDTPVQHNHCRWLASAGVAFLDSVVRERPEARDWMASNALNVLSGGAIELHRR